MKEKINIELDLKTKRKLIDIAHKRNMTLGKYLKFVICKLNK